MKREFIKDRNFYKSLLLVAIPITLQNLITFGVGLMDTIMVGRLGEIQLSASAQANQPAFIFQLIIFGLASGGSVLCSQYYGKGDMERVRTVIGIVVSASIVISTLFSALVLCFPEAIMRIYLKDQVVIDEAVSYLRISGYSYVIMGITYGFSMIIRSIEIVRISVVTGLSAFISNVFFNWMFIFGKLGAPRMELRGAALGTFIARIVEASVFLVYIFFIDKKLRFRLKNLIIKDFVILKDFIKYAFPVLANEMSWGVAVSAQAAILGKLSTEILAANSISSTLFQLATVAVFGVANAAGVAVGKSIGAGDMKKAKDAAHTITFLGILVGIFSATMVLILRRPFLSMYSVSDFTADMTLDLMAITAVVSFFSSICSVQIVGILRGAGDTKFCMKLEMIALWLVSLPLGIISGYVLKWNVLIVYAFLKIDEPIKTVITLWRQRKDNVFKDVTRT